MEVGTSIIIIFPVLAQSRQRSSAHLGIYICFKNVTLQKQLQQNPSSCPEGVSCQPSTPPQPASKAEVCLVAAIPKTQQHGELDGIVLHPESLEPITENRD